MRRILFTFLLIAITYAGFSQLKFQGAIVPGPTANSVDLVIRPNIAFSGYLTNVIFVLQIPTSIGVQPTISVTPLATNFSGVTFNTTTEAATDALTPGYTNYAYGAINANVTGINIPAGTGYPVARITFSGGPVSPTAIRLAHLIDGGASSKFQFFVEANATSGAGAGDYTNYVQMFYGSSVSPLSPLPDEGVGYSTYQYSQILAVLPIRWLGFNVARQMNDGLVTWSVDTDDDNEKYIVERSLDGNSFVAIGEVSKSPGSGVKKYTFTDRNIVNLSKKIVYYRIKSIELNNRFSYTDVKNIRLDTKGETSLFPNPAKDGFTLTIPYLNPNQDRVQLHLVNPLGQVIERKDITRVAAVNYYYNLQSSLITSGEYLLKIFEDGQLTETKRVLIKK